MGRVAGKVAIVTGGASGIGRGCAERLAAEGATVVVTDIQDGLGDEVVEGIRRAGGAAAYLHHDVTDEDAWVEVVARTVADHGGLHVLVNNAGIGVGGSIVTMALADFQRQQAVNVDGVFLGVKHGIPAMRDSGGGSIINISSIAGLRGSSHLAAYNATKGAVRMLTKGVALECAREGWGIRVNSVHPGLVDTPIWEKVNPEMLERGANVADVEAMAAFVPLKRAGLPEDIANGVLYLASDEASFVTGSELVIDGGACA